MQINIFSSENNDGRASARIHIFTLLTAVLINLAFWFIEGLGQPEHNTPVSAAFLISDIIRTCLETIIVMEASFAVSRIVIRLFWNAKYSLSFLLLQNIILLFGVVIIAAAVSYTYTLIYPESHWISWDIFLCDVLVAYFLSSVFFTSFMTNKYREEKSLAQQQTIDKLKLKTDNHFVFNSLATLCALIKEDPQAAIEFNNSMSNMYRYIVSKGDSIVVTLQEELAFIEEYRKNLAVRHSNIDFSIDEGLEGLRSLIPPLTLQGLVENAVKHNAHGKADRLKISISLSGKDDAILVYNNRLPLNSRIESSGSGLNTLDLRYKAISGKGIQIKETPESFQVTLPIIRQTDLL